jgi:hypothetical protein
MTGPEAGMQRALLIESYFGKSEHALTEADVIEITHSIKELADSPELQKCYKSGLEDREVKRHRFRALTDELRRQYFGEPPDVAYWSAIDFVGGPASRAGAFHNP